MPLDADTSSYPKAQLPVSPYDVANNIGGLLQRQQYLQSGALTISQQQLDQANQAYNYMGQAINALGPNPTKQQILGVGQKMVDMKLVPPSMIQAMDARIPQSQAEIPAFMNEWASATADHKAQIEQTRGVPTTIDNGQGIIPAKVMPLTGQIQSTGLPIQKQLPPSTPTVNPGSQQPQYLGPQSAVAAPGAVTAPGAGLPIAPSPASIQPPQATITPPRNPAFATPAPAAKDQSQVPTGPASGAPPLFEAGKNQFSSDQDLATARQTAIKPALQALPLLKTLQTSGPGSKTWNDAVAGLKNFGILPTSVGNDPTAIYQEVEKKLAQYVGGNPVGQRSDAAQTLAEAGSPNPNHQIKPALIQLTKDSIILDRLASARPNAFTDDQGNQRQDLQNYGAFRSKFPASIDERAFGLDLMEPDERTKLLDDMKKKQNTFEGQRFWKSLQMVKNQGLYNVSGQ